MVVRRRVSDNGHDRSAYRGVPDPIAMNQLRDMVSNAITSRSQLLRQSMDPRRDIDDECGYPKTTDIDVKDYRDLYDREPIATRVVQVMPAETWGLTPTVYEDEASDTVTAFEESWDALGSTLRGTSWYKSERGNPIWGELRRVDILSGIGSFGLLLIGLDDREDLRTPVKGIDEKGQKTGESRGDRKLLYLRSFSEDLVAINSYQTDSSNPRFGLPLEYNITFSDPSDRARSGIGLNLTTRAVHWSRVIHIADNLGTSPIFGAPRQRPVLNRLLDLRKLYGGSAEMYWRGAFPGMSLETHPQLGGDVSIDEDALRDTVENYINGLQRVFTLSGMSAKMLSPTVVDPTPQINAHIQAICIVLGIPQRIFMGSERGELASSQDEGSWNDIMADRQNGYVTPRIIVPFVDRLICLGVLPEPEEYTVEWPDMNALTELEKAQLAETRTRAVAQFVSGGIEALVTPLDYFVHFLDMDEEEAASILESTMDRIKEEDSGGSPLLSMVGGITGMLEMFKQFKEGAIGEETLKQQIMLFFKVDEAKAEAIIADGLPEQPEAPPSPIKVKDGESLVTPDGTQITKPNPFAKKKPVVEQPVTP